MKRNHRMLIAGLTIILVTNVVALGGVAYNRSGEPDALVEFTERELEIPYRYSYGFNSENTGLGLNFNCRLEEENGYGYGNPNCRGKPQWLNEEKLTELGFDFPAEVEEGYNYYIGNKSLPRKVYLVLEYNGAAHRRAIAVREKHLAKQRALLLQTPEDEGNKKKVKDAETSLKNEQLYRSRLFAIDAGVEKAALRKAYPDSGQYVLMQALIRPSWRNYDKSDEKEDEWIGTITKLLIGSINIPLEHREIFEPLEATRSRRYEDVSLPRYKIRIAFGKRAEPWVVEVEGM